MTARITQQLKASFSALRLLVGSFYLKKPIPDMTYNVFGGTLNLAQLTSKLLITIIAIVKYKQLGMSHYEAKH